MMWSAFRKTYHQLHIQHAFQREENGGTQVLKGRNVAKTFENHWSRWSLLFYRISSFTSTWSLTTAGFKGFIRFSLVLMILFLSWYTFQLYAELFNRLTVKKSNSVENEKADTVRKVNIDDPDALIDQSKIEAAEKQWDQEQNLFHPNIKIAKKNPCSVTVKCSPTEFSFKVVTGAANVIGPSVCFNGSIIMRNSLNNVDRGMNIAVINGVTGQSLRQQVFDLYGKDSTELKEFLKKLTDDEVVLVTTSDDAAFKLDDEAKELFYQLGSKHSKRLAFRDNWVFVGGKRMNKPSGFEQILKNSKETNKYGDWPEAITIQGCMPKLT